MTPFPNPADDKEAREDANDESATRNRVLFFCNKKPDASFAIKLASE